MYFAKKCNIIFNVLECTNADIAREGDIDPSLVSRYRTGSRQPGTTSSQFKNFCKGIIMFAQRNGMLEKLSSECKLPGVSPPQDEICEYLIGKETKKNPKRSNKSYSYITYNLFSEKLNTIMNMLDITNIRLARALNVDTSLISRFRNGVRTPPKNSSLILSICNYLYKIAKMNSMEQELFDLLGKPNLMDEYCTDEIIDIFRNWFSNDNELNSTGMMDSFLEKMDTLKQINIPQNQAPNNTLPLEISDDSSQEYFGTQGFRQAVLRFLGTVVMSDCPLVLKLYSDQNMSWLSSDPVFVQKWGALMYTVLSKKHSIKIIHNIERNLNEMLIGIEKWLPLYLSGLVEGYYCKNTYDQRFSHTLFVASGLAAIQGSHVFGTEDNGIYQYANEASRLDFYENQIDAMLVMCKPLIQVFQKFNSKDYYFLMVESSKIPGNHKCLLLSPPFATIPAGLLERILIRSKTSTKEMEAILAAHSIISKTFKTDINNRQILQYIVFPEFALLSENLKLNLSDAFAEVTIYYTPEEYSEHIESLITLLENDNYEIIPLLDSPFTNIQMEVKESFMANIQKSDLPVTTFRFSHPLMCKAISEYINTIGEKRALHIRDKVEVIKFLSRYLL